MGDIGQVADSLARKGYSLTDRQDGYSLIREVTGIGTDKIAGPLEKACDTIPIEEAVEYDGEPVAQKYLVRLTFYERVRPGDKQKALTYITGELKAEELELFKMAQTRATAAFYVAGVIDRDELEHLIYQINAELGDYHRPNSVQVSEAKE
jgi:hypothetical protein